MHDIVYNIFKFTFVSLQVYRGNLLQVKVEQKCKSPDGSLEKKFSKRSLGDLL